MGIVMVFDDLTELEKAQRMAAWREVARRIAHEVKNPLTPISLSAQRLKRRYSDAHRRTGVRRVHPDDHRPRRTDPQPGQRVLHICPLSHGRSQALPIVTDHRRNRFPLQGRTPGYRFRCPTSAEDIPQMNLDRQQFKQAMINLVDNAVAAVRNRGHISITAAYDPILKLVRLEVADDGTGIADADKIRLFEPNFSTKRPAWAGPDHRQLHCHRPQRYDTGTGQFAQRG
jgi:two-component system nitrogen regulation sensor histidine kinase NtrY